MNLHFARYSAAGNKIGVAFYQELSDIREFIEASEARRHLKELASSNGCDSVMVLVRNPRQNPALQTIVFEPNTGGEDGLFSTMCGNGIRAVAEYACEHLHHADWPLQVSTRSGVLEVEKISDHSYRVLMGNIATNTADLRNYVNPEYFPERSDLIDVEIPERLLSKIQGLKFGSKGAVCSIGFSTTEIDPERRDGEPHLVLELDASSARTMEELTVIARSYGPAMCADREIFPLDMNINFIARSPGQPNVFMICTFERNLGNDPERSVTQACGTGSTFAGASYMRGTPLNNVTARCLGGNLVVEKNGSSMYLSGGVARDLA